MSLRAFFLGFLVSFDDSFLLVSRVRKFVWKFYIVFNNMRFVSNQQRSASKTLCAKPVSRDRSALRWTRTCACSSQNSDCNQHAPLRWTRTFQSQFLLLFGLVSAERYGGKDTPANLPHRDTINHCLPSQYKDLLCFSIFR